MSIRTIPLLLLSTALGSCASQPNWTPARGFANPGLGGLPTRHEYAWDGLGQNPNRPQARLIAKRPAAPAGQDPIAQREAVLVTLRPYSAAWWVVHDEIEADREAMIARKLVICRGCLDSASQAETTGSIARD